MRKIIATFVIACSVACIVGCGGSKPSTGRENTSTLMDSAALSTPPTTPDSTRQK